MSSLGGAPMEVSGPRKRDHKNHDLLTPCCCPVPRLISLSPAAG